MRPVELRRLVSGRLSRRVGITSTLSQRTASEWKKANLVPPELNCAKEPLPLRVLQRLEQVGRALFYAWAQEQKKGRSGHLFTTQVRVKLEWHAQGSRCAPAYCN